MLTWSPQLTELFALLAIVMAAAFALLWWRAETRGGRRSQARQRRAQAGEDHAEWLLENMGFRILDRQLRRAWSLEINGVPATVHSRADLLVEAVHVPWAARGSTFVAEVKTGTRAPDPTFPATRRQLLEYRLVFNVSGVLLVDMEAHEVHHITFPGVLPEGPHR